MTSIQYFSNKAKIRDRSIVVQIIAHIYVYIYICVYVCMHIYMYVYICRVFKIIYIISQADI